jgi:CDP-glycerol glycerophosphotransferase
VPQVSVIVIAYNDGARLPAALESVLAQDVDLELVVVDDASTDNTAAVLDRFAAADERVRPQRLASHSGGHPGLPRNIALRASRGEWLAFLDSDDLLEPGALRALLDAAQTSGADLVCGLVRRVHADGTVHAWKGHLHDSRRFVTEGDLREALHDTIAPGKLIRRSLLSEHGIEFPEDLLFEDYPFSAALYLHARSILLIPDPVYVWNVGGLGADASITRRLDDLRTFEHRSRAHQLAVDVFRDAGRPDLVEELQAKFLTHDLRLHLRYLYARDAEHVQRLRALALPVLADVPPAVKSRLGATDLVAHRALLAGDFPLAVLAARLHYRGMSDPAGDPPRRTGQRLPGPAWWRRPGVWLAAAADVASGGLQRRGRVIPPE